MYNNETTVMLIELIVAIVGVLFGRYVFPKYRDTIQNSVNEFALLLGYAESFVAYAKQFMKCSGHEKMDDVVEKLGIVCEKKGIDMDQETLRAIGQKAYDAMLLGEAQANNANVVVQMPVTDQVENISVEDPDWDDK